MLHEEDIRYEVVPPPANLSAGCGIALRIRLEDVPRVTAAFATRDATYYTAIHLLDEQQQAVEKLA